MTPELTIRTLQVAAIIESWVVAVWLFRRVRPDKRLPISTHGGTTTTSYLVFALTLTIHPVVFVLFCLLWVIPAIQPNPIFIPVMLFAAACQILTGWIRDGKNPALHSWHNVVAISMSATLPVMTALLLASGRLSQVAFAVNALALGTMLLLLALFLRAMRTRSNYLWYQSAYILSFQLATIAIVVAG